MGQSSSGFDLSLATYVLEQGDTVITAVRKPETLRHLLETWTEDQLLVLEADVSNPDDIKRASQDRGNSIRSHRRRL